MPNARRLPNSLVVINAVCILGVISFLALTKRQAWAPVTRDLGFWFEDALLGLETDLDRNGNAHSNSFPASWSSWGDSTVYSVDTNSYHPSRPAAFGPHVTSNDGLTGRLIPIHVFTSVEDPDNYGCPRQDSIDPQTWSPSKSVTHRPHPPANWIALIKRGSCSFANKIRLAASLGATAVVVGNNEPKDHLGDVMGALIGMWSPGDTSDISIPSVFVSTNSYLDLLRVYQGSSQQHGGDQTDGVVVVLSKDRLVQWDLTDLLVLLLFLPSVMTFFTLLSHRLRMFRQERQQRAPRQLVESIPWVKWGEDFEKPAAPLNQADQAAIEASASTSQDLEAATVPLHQSFSTSISLWWHRVKLWCTKSVADDGLIDQLKNPPLPFSSIKSARLFASQSDCAICLSDFEQGEAVRCLPCGHLLHAACCDPWFLNTNRCCPICRVSVDLKPSDVSGARQSQEDVVDPTEHTPLLAT